MPHALALLVAAASAALLATGLIGTAADERDGGADGPVAAPIQAQLRAQLPVQPTVRDDMCLSDADLREAVAEKRVIPPLAAIRAAREALPRADIQRASLCRHEQGLVYRLTALRRDGHFVQVLVDARSGQVSGP